MDDRAPWAPMKAISGPLPRGPGWAYEVKWDGYRVLAVVSRTAPLRLWSSNGLDATRRFPGLDALAELDGVDDAVFDGEALALDEHGRPSFQALQQGGRDVAYVVFDLLRLNGHELIRRPWAERRELLVATLGAPSGPRWSLSPVTDDGPALVAATRAQAMEGVVAKRLDSAYQPGRRSPAWVKVKHRNEQEFVVGGWLAGAGNRSGSLGALLVGYHDDAGALRYAGRVGTGFGAATLRMLDAELAARARATSPFTGELPTAVRRQARWVEPELVAQVAFAEWTNEAILRHPSFLGLRDDVDPAAVTRAP